MKKIILTTVCALAVAGTAFAQGSVNWGVIGASMSAQTNSTQYSPLFGLGGVGPGGAAVGGAIGGTGLAAAGFYYELLYNSVFTGLQVSGALSPSNSFASLFTSGTWHDVGLGATNSLNLAGRLVPIAANTGAIVPWANGITNNIVLVGWSADLGTSWSVVSNELATGTYVGVLGAQNGFFGVSAAGYINPFSGANPGAVLFNGSATANGLPILSANTQLYLLPTVVPEPATIAMLGLSGLSLLLFRRRKS
jgi:hypothetical protein